MGIKAYFDDLASRDNYDEVMEYLAVAETKHAPRFEFDDAPEQLRELIAERVCRKIMGGARRRSRSVARHRPLKCHPLLESVSA